MWSGKQQQQKTNTIHNYLRPFLQKKNPFNPDTKAKHFDFLSTQDKENLYYQIFIQNTSETSTVSVPRAIIIVCHSFASHVGQMEKIGVRFSSCDFCVAMYDTRGCGRSTGKRGHCKSLQHYLLDLCIVVDKVWDHLINDYKGELTEETVRKLPLFFYGHGIGSVRLLLLDLIVSLMRNTGANNNNGEKWDRQTFYEMIGQERPAKQDEEEEQVFQDLIHHLAKIEPVVSGFIITSPYLKMEFQNWQKKVIGFLAKRFQTYTIDLDVPVVNLTSDPLMQKTLLRDTFRVGDMTARTVTDLEKLTIELLRPEIAKQLTLPLLLVHGANDNVALPHVSKQFFDLVGSSDKTIRILPNLRHALHLETDREDAFKIINDWLNEKLNITGDVANLDEGESRVNKLIDTTTSAVAAASTSRRKIPEQSDFELSDVEPSKLLNTETNVSESVPVPVPHEPETEQQQEVNSNAIENKSNVDEKITQQEVNSNAIEDRSNADEKITKEDKSNVESVKQETEEKQISEKEQPSPEETMENLQAGNVQTIEEEKTRNNVQSPVESTDTTTTPLFNQPSDSNETTTN
jgi:alpha-beta hydrolase superfamily lysophospholipase